MKGGRKRFQRSADTEHAQRYRDLPEEDKIRWRARIKKHTDAAQLETVATAEHRHQRWTPEEDDEVLFGEGTDRDIALRIGRTWAAIRTRRANLVRMLEEGDILYGELVSTQPIKVAPTLCPCGASDGTHEAWCPEKQ